MIDIYGKCEPSPSDVSGTQGISMVIKTDRSNEYYDIVQRYQCKNRITKAVIKMTRIRFFIANRDVGIGTYLTCLDHNETRNCENKTEALYYIRRPWIWCDGCAEIHFNTEWQNQLHHGIEDKNYD